VLRGTTGQPFFHDNQSVVPLEHHGGLLQSRFGERFGTPAHHGKTYMVELSYLESAGSLGIEGSPSDFLEGKIEVPRVDAGS
jgi:hypothetical protein